MLSRRRFFVTLGALGLAASAGLSAVLRLRFNRDRGAIVVGPGEHLVLENRHYRKITIAGGRVSAAPGAEPTIDTLIIHEGTVSLV